MRKKTKTPEKTGTFRACFSIGCGRVGGGAIDKGQTEHRDEKPVEGVRIRGARVGFRVCAKRLSGLAQPLEKGGLSAAGTAFHDDAFFYPAAGVELIKSHGEAFGGICAKKPACVHSIPPFLHIIVCGAPWAGAPAHFRTQGDTMA